MAKSRGIVTNGKRMKPSALLRMLAATALLGMGCAGSVHAQYSWIDERGIKQYSDMPPPASVPKSRILKQPGSASPVAAEDAASATSADTATTVPSLADRDAEFRKRQAEQAAKDKKAAEESKLARERKRDCARLADYQRTLESGIRVTSTGKDGERSFMSDEQRSREIRDNKRALADCR